MDSRLSPEQDTLFVAPDASSPGRLLESGLLCVRQGRYTEGVAFFALARERLSPDQAHLAAVLDAFTQSHKTYSQAQEELLQASKHFARADAEQQVQLAALENLLSILLEEVNKVSPNVGRLQQIDRGNWLLHIFRSSPEDLNSNLLPTQLPQRTPEDNRQLQSLSLSLLEDSTTLAALYITCFGHFEVTRSGRLVALCSNRSGQSIFRFLVVKQEHCATSDMLQTLLWPEDQPEAALNKLHIAISALRRSLNYGYSCEPGCGYIVCKNRTYYLNPAVVVRTDVDEFLQYYQAGQQANEERMTLYEKACRFYTGPFLSEDIYADWSFLQREELSRIYLTMCRALIDYYMQHKRYEDAAKWTTAILKENRCDEAAHQQLMQIFAAQGRRSEALQQYQRCKLVLREELGVEPLPETVLLFQTLRANGTSSNQ